MVYRRRDFQDIPLAKSSKPSRALRPPILCGGIRPSPEDTIVVSFNISSFDGQTDYPQLSQKKIRVHVKDLLPGLAEGVQMMTTQSKGMLIVPPALSYGDSQWPDPLDRGTPLIFTVELHEIISAASP
ncbi:MAG: FKBP-type peptidyl-prolyl cis-trans isomerase [Oleiharenicola lentus]